MSDRDIEGGSRIKKIRQHKKITQQELSAKMGVSQTAIALWENGSRSISLEAIDEIAFYLNVSASYLLFGEKDFKDNIPKDNHDDGLKNIDTIAAHFDGDEYTEEELEQIRKFAEFIKSQRKDTE